MLPFNTVNEFRKNGVTHSFFLVRMDAWPQLVYKSPDRVRRLGPCGGFREEGSAVLKQKRKEGKTKEKKGWAKKTLARTWAKKGCLKKLPW